MEENLKRKDNESLFNYYKRITLNKKEYDIDYTEWGNCILGDDCNYSSENLRKAYYVAYRMFGKLDNENESNISDDDVLKEVELRKIELEKEKIKIKDQRRRLNELIRSQARFEQIKEDVMQAANNINPK